MSDKKPSYNIPFGDPETANRFRKAFSRSQFGADLALFDFSQIEFDILGLKPRIDPHAETAKLVFGTETPTPEQHRDGAVINFGILYGSDPKDIRSLTKTPGKGR